MTSKSCDSLVFDLSGVHSNCNKVFLKQTALCLTEMREADDCCAVAIQGNVYVGC